MSLGVPAVEEGDRTAMIRWVEHGRTVPRASACCWRAAVIPTPFPSPCIPYVTQRAPHSSPEHEVAPIESPDTAKRHEGRECWHRRGQRAEDGTTSSPSPSLSAGTLCPLALFLHFCPDPVSGLPRLWLTGCWQLELPDMSSFTSPFWHRETFWGGFWQDQTLAFPESALSCVLLRWSPVLTVTSRHLTQLQRNHSQHLCGPLGKFYGNFLTTAAACALHEGVKWLTSKSHYAAATVITT